MKTNMHRPIVFNNNLCVALNKFQNNAYEKKQKEEKQTENISENHNPRVYFKSSNRINHQTLHICHR